MIGIRLAKLKEVLIAASLPGCLSEKNSRYHQDRESFQGLDKFPVIVVSFLLRMKLKSNGEERKEGGKPAPGEGSLFGRDGSQDPQRPVRSPGGVIPGALDSLAKAGPPHDIHHQFPGLADISQGVPGPRRSQGNEGKGPQNGPDAANRFWCTGPRIGAGLGSSLRSVGSDVPAYR